MTIINCKKKLVLKTVRQFKTKLEVQVLPDEKKGIQFDDCSDVNHNVILYEKPRRNIFNQVRPFEDLSCEINPQSMGYHLSCVENVIEKVYSVARVETKGKKKLLREEKNSRRSGTS